MRLTAVRFIKGGEKDTLTDQNGLLVVRTRIDRGIRSQTPGGE